ncbi:MAG: transposase [Clostridia bacterium]|nr:transposase [Clostridia bacterium]
MEEKRPERKPTRIKNYDYSRVGAYFITICTKNRAEILCNIVGGDVLDAPIKVRLLQYGEIAEKYIKQLNEYYENISVEKYVIMPDHIHILIVVKKEEDTILKGGASRTSPPTRQHSSVSRYVSTFKRFCNKEYGENIWQESFFDHIIRNNEDYEEHIKYIHENPTKWYYENK